MNEKTFIVFQLSIIVKRKGFELLKCNVMTFVIKTIILNELTVFSRLNVWLFFSCFHMSTVEKKNVLKKIFHQHPSLHQQGQAAQLLTACQNPHFFFALLNVYCR